MGRCTWHDAIACPPADPSVAWDGGGYLISVASGMPPGGTLVCCAEGALCLPAPAYFGWAMSVRAGDRLGAMAGAHSPRPRVFLPSGPGSPFPRRLQSSGVLNAARADRGLIRPSPSPRAPCAHFDSSLQHYNEAAAIDVTDMVYHLNIGGESRCWHAPCTYDG